MSFRPVLLAALLVLGACKKDNPAYCEGDLDCGAGVSCDVVTHTCMTPDAGAPDARVDCTADEQCDGFCDDGTSLCAPCTNANDCGARTDGRNQCADGVCVQCVTSNDCGLELPICENNSCRACTMDEECSELAGPAGEIGLCASPGACVGESGVIFVEAAGACPGSGTAPDPFCELQGAVDLVDGGDDRRIIVVRTGDYDPVAIQDLELQIRGKSGARITGGSSDVPRVEITGNASNVTMTNFAVDGASSSPTPAVYCTGGATCAFDRFDVSANWRGFVAENATLMRVERSKIHQNQGGGILTFNSDYTIVNNLILLNGRSDGSVGGAQLGAPLGAVHDFHYNTVWKNTVQSGVSATGGVICTSSTVLSSNILWDNTSGEVSTSCTVDHSIVDDTLIGAMLTNSSDDPMFVMPDVFDPDLHVMAGSPAAEMGEAAGAPTVDYFGQARSGSPDSGADELGTP